MGMEWVLDQMGIEPVGYQVRPNGIFFQMGLDQMRIRPNGFRPNGNIPLIIYDKIGKKSLWKDENEL